jgi:hypothetical protein
MESLKNSDSSQPYVGQSYTDLPNEIVTLIFENLPYDNLKRIQRVSKQCNAVGQAFHHDFPHLSDNQLYSRVRRIVCTSVEENPNGNIPGVVPVEFAPMVATVGIALAAVPTSLLPYGELFPPDLYRHASAKDKTLLLETTEWQPEPAENVAGLIRDFRYRGVEELCMAMKRLKFEELVTPTAVEVPLKRIQSLMNLAKPSVISNLSDTKVAEA